MEPSGGPITQNGVPLPQVPPQAAPQAMVGENPNREYVAAVLLSWLLGGWGIDRFYLGHTGLGVAKLLTGGGLGIWSLIDLILVTWGKMTQKDNPTPLKGFAQHNKLMKILVVVLGILGTLAIVGILITLVLAMSAGVKEQAKDVSVKTAVIAMQSYAEADYAERGRYPTASELDGMLQGRVDANSKSNVTYTPSPAGCDNTAAKCTGFVLEGQLGDGQVFTKDSSSGLQ
ncbi:MAG: hypothetical protein QG629_674 [Patescibacteria group bacterium]|nr:TM2 domain-containing protein [Candidatus Saccharibacteria bacterium]MDQ5963592.1 hypothetical protein [Patescibacteria group bacterium]